MFKVNNKNTINFEHILHLFLVFLLLTFNNLLLTWLLILHIIRFLFLFSRFNFFLNQYSLKMHCFNSLFYQNEVMKKIFRLGLWFARCFFYP